MESYSYLMKSSFRFLLLWFMVLIAVLEKNTSKKKKERRSVLPLYGRIDSLSFRFRFGIVTGLRPKSH